MEDLNRASRYPSSEVQPSGHITCMAAPVWGRLAASGLGSIACSLSHGKNVALNLVSYHVHGKGHAHVFTCSLLVLVPELHTQNGNDQLEWKMHAMPLYSSLVWVDCPLFALTSSKKNYHASNIPFITMLEFMLKMYLFKERVTTAFLTRRNYEINANFWVPTLSQAWF